MEPKVLIIGRRQEEIDVVVEELNMFGRDVRGSSEKHAVTTILQNEAINIVLIGAGLTDDLREEMAAYVTEIRPDVGIHLIKRVEGGSPFNMLGFVNKSVFDWKVNQRVGKSALQ